MALRIAQLFVWLRALRRRPEGGREWVEPGNTVTRAIYTPDTNLPLPAQAVEAPLTVELPAATVAEIEAAAAAEEAAARACEAAREAALPMPAQMAHETIAEPAQPGLAGSELAQPNEASPSESSADAPNADPARAA